MDKSNKSDKRREVSRRAFISSLSIEESPIQLPVASRPVSTKKCRNIYPHSVVVVVYATVRPRFINTTNSPLNCAKYVCSSEKVPKIPAVQVQSGDPLIYV